MGVKNLVLKQKMIEGINASNLSKKEKRKAVRALVWNPWAFQVAKAHTEDAAEDEGVELSEIDWENFDWEAAADFWVKIIEAVAKIILAVI